MNATKVSICNAALGVIGARSIQSFEDGTKEAEYCRNFYESQRKALLRQYPWSCAKKRTQLAPLSTHPSFGYKHAFPLPSDFIRLFDAGCLRFEVEGRAILADADVINLIYIFDNNNEDTWDSMLVECMELQLASKLCKPITGSDAAGQTALSLLTRRLEEARRISAQETQSESIQVEDSVLLGARY